MQVLAILMNSIYLECSVLKCWERGVPLLFQGLVEAFVGFVVCRGIKTYKTWRLECLFKMFTLSHTKNLFQQLSLLFKILLMALSAPKTSFGMFLSMLVGKKKEVQSGRSKLLILAINGSKISWMAENAPSKFTRRKSKTNSHGSLKFSRMNNFLEFCR